MIPFHKTSLYYKKIHELQPTAGLFFGGGGVFFGVLLVWFCGVFFVVGLGVFVLVWFVLVTIFKNLK